MSQKLQGHHGEFEQGKGQPFLDWLFLIRLYLTEILKLSVFELEQSSSTQNDREKNRH